MTSKFNRKLPQALAALAVLCAGAASANSSVVSDYDYPPMPAYNAVPAVAQAPVMTPLAAIGPLSREQVRAELQAAREAGTMSLHGEAGDTPQVLMAREAFNVRQAETIMAEYRAEQQRLVALAEAEARRAEVEAAALQPLAMEGLAAGESADEVPLLPALPGQDAPDSVFIISLPAGLPEQEQQRRAEEARRELVNAGVSAHRIYVETAGS